MLTLALVTLLVSGALFNIQAGGTPEKERAPERILARQVLPVTRYEFPVGQNLDVAARDLGRTTLKPGQSFSLNDALGKRTPEKGYKAAPVYSGGGVGIKELGGGLCMVSTALYDIFLKGGLTILERHPHQKSVGYARPGLDAAIHWGYKDLKVKNPYSFPVSFRIFREGNTFTAELFAAGKLPWRVEIERQVSRAVIPGQVHNGFRVRTLRKFYTDGILIKKEVLSLDSFQAADLHSEKVLPEQDD